jgi:hypothetical protein
MPKTEERTYPDLVEATRTGPRPRHATSESTDADDPHSVEVVITDDWPTESGPTDQMAVVTQEVLDRSDGGTADEHSRKTAERKAVPEEPEQRPRRSTLVSPIPAMVAEWMRKEAVSGGVPAAPDPAAPEVEEGVRDLTRRLGDSSDQQRFDDHESAAYTVEVVDDGNAERRQRAARLLDRARACLDAGDHAGAVAAAEAALEEADEAAPPGIVEVIEPARPLLARVFAAFVGSLAEVPVLARREEEIATLPLDDRTRAVLALVDGARSLAQIFDGARVPSADALRITTALLRAGVIRVV